MKGSLTTCLLRSAVVSVCCLFCFFAFSIMGGAVVRFKGSWNNAYITNEYINNAYINNEYIIYDTSLMRT